jgi:hypothetical protein
MSIARLGTGRFTPGGGGLGFPAASTSSKNDGRSPKMGFGPTTLRPTLLPPRRSPGEPVVNFCVSVFLPLSGPLAPELTTI